MADFLSSESKKSKIDFFLEKHIAYIKKVSSDTTSFEFVVSQHLRMSGVYWGLCAISLLGVDLNRDMNGADIIEWVKSCQHDNGGFGGSVGHDAHILYTLSAIQICALCDRMDALGDADKIAAYISSLQQPDGSFAGDKWGEIDTRFSYCAFSALALLGKLSAGLVDVERGIAYIASCQNFDGGFGVVPGAESHAGQIFCCVGALSIAGGLSTLNEDLLGWWLAERQCDNGGLNGRPEKQADVCYSWWILSTLSIIGRISWIDRDGLAQYIARCQDEDGGISDAPGNMGDIFHTFFGICGLSLLSYFDDVPEYSAFRKIDPTYALPVDIVQRLGLPAHILRDVEHLSK